MESKRKVILGLVFIVLVLGLLSYFFWGPLSSLFTNPDKVRDLVSSYGSLGPLIFILLVIIQIFIAPIPGQIAGLTSGYLFGAFFGTIYSMIGLIIGSWLVFLLSRKFGRPFVEKFVSIKLLKKFDKIMKKNGTFVLFLIFLIPGLPDDAVCYLAGLTDIKIRKLVLIAALGRFPGFLILNLVGAGIASDNQMISWILFGGLVVLSIIGYIFRKKLEKMAYMIYNKLSKKKSD